MRRHELWLDTVNDGDYIYASIYVSRLYRDRGTESLPVVKPLCARAYAHFIYKTVHSRIFFGNAKKGYSLIFLVLFTPFRHHHQGKFKIWLCFYLSESSGRTKVIG